MTVLLIEENLERSEVVKETISQRNKINDPFQTVAVGYWCGLLYQEPSNSQGHFP